jgi:hypothetical protein
MSSGSRQNLRQNPNQNYSQNNNQNYNNQNQEQQQSSNQLQISVASRRALDLLKKSRANRSAFMIIAPNETVRLQFDPTKSRIEEKVFNGQKTERVAHSVVNIDDRTAGQKTLSLTYKQSQPIEEAMEDGYTVMEVTKVGEGFSLSYDIKPIE